MKNLLLVIFITTSSLFSQGGQSISDTTSTKLFGPEYMPLSENLHYIYDSSVGEAEMEMEKQDTTFRVSYSTSAVEYSQNLHHANGGIYLTRTENEIVFWGKSVTYENPVVRIPFPVKVGQEWSWEGNQMIDEYKGKVTISGKVLAEENITTEAGTFNCIKIEMTVVTTRKTDRLVEWLAPGIGIVKSEAHLASGGFTGALQSFLGLEVIEFSLKKILE